MSKIEFSDITVIIRSAGERTVPILQNLLKEQVSSDQIYEVNETPLSSALKKCYEIGINDNKKYILILDGDVLPFKDMISTLIKIFQGLNEQVFGLQCKVLDKMNRSYRYAGIHMHRTSHLQKAISFVPLNLEVMRPESFTIDRMSDTGNPTLFIDNVLAIHDFEQFYCDLFRKGYFLAHKSSKQIPYLKEIWSKYSKADSDYKVLLEGLEKGEKFNGLVISDKQKLEEPDIDEILSDLGLQEKKSLENSKIGFQEVQNMYNEFKIPSEYWNYKLFDNENSYDVSFKRRFFQLKGRLGLLRIIPWLIGNTLEKKGRKIKEIMESTTTHKKY